MEIICLDMEGTLTPEIWEQVASNTGIESLNKTTRDIPNYAELMDYRLDIMNKHKVTLVDIQNAVDQLELLPGALNFLQSMRKDFQIVILSDTFHEFASPLMKKLGYPLLLCHSLTVDEDQNILDYHLRHKEAKKQAIQGFQEMGYRCFAAGDSYNDIQMFEVAEKGFFINAPSKITESYPDITFYNNYNDLEKAFRHHSIYTS